jgi:transposase
MARPDKLTPEVAQRIVDAIRVGATVELAAAAAGVGIRTLYRWKKRGETSTSGKYWEFWERVKKAAAEEELGGVAEILLASRPKLIERETVTRLGNGATPPPALGAPR